VCYRARVTSWDLFSWFVLVPIAALASLGVVLFEQPVRAAGSFVLAVVTVSALVYAEGAPEAAGLLLWILGAGVGLLLLTTILLLGLTTEETGRRRFSVRRTLAVAALVWLGAALFGVLSEALPGAALRAAPAVTVGLATALLESWSLPLSLAFLALAVGVVASLVIVRRRV
jgi:NADH:ubiquinone oxidoreductase subunit 6 (subunit J)